MDLGQLTKLYFIDQALEGNFISFRQNPSLQLIAVGNATVSTCLSTVGECASGMPATPAQGFADCYIDPAMVPLSAWNVTLQVPPFLLNGTLCNVVNVTIADL